MSKSTHSVYRCYGDAEETDLLYVGRTSRGEQRLQEHARTASWWPEVDHCTVGDHLTGGLGQADRIEKRTIQTEHPQHNIVHNR